MPLYRKKPIVIEARQWTGGAIAAGPIINWILTGEYVAVWVEGLPEIKASNGEFVQFLEPEHIRLNTFEGVTSVVVGDWILRNVQGEFDRCSNEVFETSYEAV